METQKSNLSDSKKLFIKKEKSGNVYQDYGVKDFLKKLGIDISSLQK